MWRGGDGVYSEKFRIEVSGVDGFVDMKFAKLSNKSAAN